MRPFRRYFAFSGAILFVALFALIALVPKTCAAQSPASLRVASATGQQTPAAAPTDWDTAVGELADRIAAIMPPSARIDLVVNNVSSLSADEVATIGERLRAELTTRHFRLAGAETPDANLTVTLSEGTDGYLIVAAACSMRASDKSAQVAMVSISQSGEEGGAKRRRVARSDARMGSARRDSGFRAASCGGGRGAGDDCPRAGTAGFLFAAAGSVAARSGGDDHADAFMAPRRAGPHRYFARAGDGRRGDSRNPVQRAISRIRRRFIAGL